MAAELSSNTSRAEGRDFGVALCIITGASKGFGRSLAGKIAPMLKPNSVLILVARSEDKLQELKMELGVAAAGEAGPVIRCVVADLGQKEGVESVIREAREAPCSSISRLLLINNAASLGDVSRYARDFNDMDEVDSYMSMNVSSALCLTGGILSMFPARVGLHRCVVNVSSLCALKPFPSWVLYCTGKAARDMMFSVLAKEEPELRVLSYAPGPLDTDMHLYARINTADENMKDLFKTMHAEGRLLTCEESVEKLINVLLVDDFSSGAHIDFYDL